MSHDQAAYQFFKGEKAAEDTLAAAATALNVVLNTTATSTFVSAQGYTAP